MFTKCFLDHHNAYLAYILRIRTSVLLQEEKLIPHPAPLASMQCFPMIRGEPHYPLSLQIHLNPFR